MTRTMSHLAAILGEWNSLSDELCSTGSPLLQSSSFAYRIERLLGR